MKTLIRGAQVVFPKATEATNVLLEDGKIVAVDAAATQACDELVEAEGLTLLPGVVDDQVHFREPGMEHKEDIHSGSVACAAGGVTTFLEMPNTVPNAVDQESLAWKYDRGAKTSVVNYGFYIGATGSNVLELQKASHAPGIKIFIGSSTGNLLVDEQEALEEIFAKTTLPICAHCEDETTVRANRAALGERLTIHDHSRIRNEEAALIATKRAIDLATRHKHRFHVLHVSTAIELPEIAAGGELITAEVCPHHLFFSVDDYERLGSLVQMNPSVKDKANCPLLWDGLLDGTIQVVATDHAPHTLEEKDVPYPASPSGIPAVENSLALFLNQVNQGECTLQQVASWMSDAPARVWGLVGKGRIEAGYDADLVLVDMNKQKTISNEGQFTKSKWSPWSGTTLQGWAVRTFVHGQTVFSESPEGKGAVDESARGAAVVCDHQRGGFWATPDGIGI